MKLRSVAPMAFACLVACEASGGNAPRSDAPAESTPVVTFVTPHGDVPVNVEVAATPDERSRGLMFRKDLGPSRGMVFVFPDVSEHPFWMKNTYVSLDIIFLDEHKAVVGVVANTEPLSEAYLTVQAPSKYVVEVNAGFAAANGIGTGGAVRFEHVSEDPGR